MTKHTTTPNDGMGAGLIAVGGQHERTFAPAFTFDFQAIGPQEAYRAEYIRLRDRIHRLENSRISRLFKGHDLILMRADLAMIPMEEKWRDGFHNVVTTVGKNSVLDVYFRAQTQITAWYVGLISAASYTTGPAAGDTAGTHGGWLEAGAANAPTYSQGTRPALTVASAASGGSLSSSAASAFSITGTGTAKGAFIISVSTKDNGTGTLYSAGTFTGGDRAVINGDTINVSSTLGMNG